MSAARTVLVVALVLIAAACGGDEASPSAALDAAPTTEAPTSEALDAAPTTEAPTSEAADPTPEPPTEQAPGPSATPDPPQTPGPLPTEVAAPTTTPEPEAAPEPPTGFDLALVPDLYARAAEAFNDPGVDPYAIAEELSGFPFEIHPPPGSALARGILAAVDVTTFFVGTGDLEWNWHFAAFAQEPFADLVFDDEEGGPGAAEVTAFFDPILAGLGFDRTTAVKSAGFEADPSDPISINWTYEPADAVQLLNGTPGDVVNVRIWANENLAGNYSDEIIPGYAIEATATFAAGDVPVPLLRAVADALPLPPDATLDAARLSLNDRGADSFAAQEGLGTLAVAVELVWLTAQTPDDVKDFFQRAEFGDLLVPGDIGFGDEIDPEGFEDLTGFGSALVLLQRYDVDLRAEPQGAGTRLTLRLTIEQRDVIPYAE